MWLLWALGGAEAMVPDEVPSGVSAAAPVPVRRFRVSGRALDDAGKPLGNVMVSNGLALAFTQADGRYVLDFEIEAGQWVTLVAELLYTGPCDDGDCGIAVSSDLVPDAIGLEGLAKGASGASGVFELRHDFRLSKPRKVAVVPRVPGEGWPYLGLSCKDPAYPERVLMCPTRGAASVDCGCPPGAAVIDVYQAGLRVPVPAAAERVEVDLRGYGGLAGRLVRGGRPVYGHLVLAEDVAGPLQTRPVDGEFRFGPIPVRPVHLVYVTRDDRRIDLGVFEPGKPSKALGDFEVPPWDPARE